MKSRRLQLSVGLAISLVLLILLLRVVDTGAVAAAVALADGRLIVIGGEYNGATLLLGLLRDLQLRRKTRSMLLMSATPMQTQPWEPWDLLAVLGEGAPWLDDFANVRDLYGAVMNEGAAKGILVTTSGYGKSSFDFAEHKPLELVSGSHLLFLLEEHTGVRARIAMPEDWVDPLPDAPTDEVAVPAESVEVPASTA